MGSMLLRSGSFSDKLRKRPKGPSARPFGWFKGFDAAQEAFGLKGQIPHSPGQRPGGICTIIHCALQGQNH